MMSFISLRPFALVGMLTAAVTGLTACGTSMPTRLQDNTPQELGYKTADTLQGKLSLAKAQELEQAVRAEGSWTTESQRQILNHYRDAYRYLPHSYRVLEGYYRNLFTRDSQLGKASAKLKELYEVFPESQRKSYMAPEYITAVAALNQNDRALAWTSLLSALDTTPGNAHLWGVVAWMSEIEGRLPLAYYAWSQSAKLDSASKSYAKMADTLMKMAEKRECFLEDQNKIGKAAQHYARAASMGNSTDLYEEAARGYYRTGRLPLALHMMQKAHELEPTNSKKSLLAEFYISMGEYQKAIDWLQLIDRSQSDFSPTFEAISPLVALGKDEEAQALLERIYLGAEANTDFLEMAAGNWLSSLTGKSLALKFDNSTMDEEAEWRGRVKGYLESGNANYDLVDTAGNSCQKTEALFYTAYSYWQAEDLNMTRKLLRDVLEQEVRSYTEWFMARAILYRLESQ